MATNSSTAYKILKKQLLEAFNKTCNELGLRHDDDATIDAYWELEGVMVSSVLEEFEAKESEDWFNSPDYEDFKKKQAAQVRARFYA
jgi:hypothetical protein